MRIITGLFAGLVSLASIALPAHAGLIETCDGNSFAEETAPACTEIIENEKLPGSVRAKAYVARAGTYKEGSLDEAVKDMDKAIELTPKIADYYAKRAEYKKKLSGILISPEVIEDYTSAIELDPENPQRYADRAAYNFAYEDFTAALADVEKAIELKEPKGYLLRGLIRTRIGEPSEAISDLNKSIAALESGKKEGREGHAVDGLFEFGLRGLNYLALKKYDLAIADISVAISTYDHVILHIMRGNAFAAKKQYEMAIEDYTKVLNDKPDQMEAYYLRANAYEQIGNPAKAAADRTKAALITAGLKKP